MSQFLFIIPEILLALLAMVMQVFVVFNKNLSRQISFVTIILGVGIAFYLSYSSLHYVGVVFSESFAVSYSIAIYKTIVMLLTVMSLVVYHDLAKIRKKKVRMEFVTLVLLSTLGIFISISARDLVLLFCGLELQGLSGYALAAFNVKEVKSSEAGLKYFVLGALMSCLMLLGISFLYGFSGSIKFAEISYLINSELNIGLIIGSILLLSSILFKLSAAPMHIWTPDVYDGAPISSVIYFSTAQKYGMLFVLVNITDEIIGNYTSISSDLMKVVAILSMIVGALGAVRQESLKRLMAYSTILNVGYVLVGISLHSIKGNHSAFVFMLIYVIGVIGFFACLVALFGEKTDQATFEDLKGVGGSRKTLAAVITIIMFSMIGIPPLAGFWGKYYIFYNAVLVDEIGLAVIGFVASVISAFYYLKVIKVMYFVEREKELVNISTKRGLYIITALSMMFTLFFFIFANKFLP